MEIFADAIDFTGKSIPLSIKEGADLDFDIAFTLNGLPTSITGITLTARVVDNTGATVKELIFAPVDAPNGLGNFSANFDGVPVGLYKWQVRQTFNSKDKDLFEGPFEVEKSVL